MVIFPQRSERSSAGICEFSNTERATEALMLANHTPVESPGKFFFHISMTFIDFKVFLKETDFSTNLSALPSIWRTKKFFIY